MDQPNPPEKIAADRAIDETLHQNENELAQAAAPAAKAGSPRTFSGYQVQHCLGNGAYGSVWLAIERNTGKQVAIKFYSHRRGIDWSLLNREVEKLAVLYTSRDIVGLLQVGWDADPPYYVMEYLQNGSLAQLGTGALAGFLCADRHSAVTMRGSCASAQHPALRREAGKRAP